MTTTNIPPAAGNAAPSVWRTRWRRFAQHRLGLVGTAFLLFAVLFVTVGPLIHRTDQVHTDLANILRPPGGGHPLGTEEHGYDLLGRLMLGGQSALLVGFAAAVLASLVGTIWGAVAGYFGGIVDSVLMRILDSLLAIPPLLLVLVIASMVRPTIPVLIGIVALVSWLVTARLVRGACLSLRERDFVQAARAMGQSPATVILRHIVPNVIGIVVVQTSIEMANAILLLAALSFLGLGPPAPATNWGDMLSNGLNYIYNGNWWLIYPAGLMIVLTVLSLNWVGDALRDAFDVRLQAKDEVA